MHKVVKLLSQAVDRCLDKVTVIVMSKLFANLKAVVAATTMVVMISRPQLVFSQEDGQLLGNDRDLTEGLTGKAESVGNTSEEAQLLTQLVSADVDEARRIARELNAIWDRSGSPAMDLLLQRGRDAVARGEVDQALEHLTALTDHAPSFSRGWSERARVFFISERFGPSVADLERALILNPNDFDTIFALGRVLEFFQRPDQAYAAYARALSIHPHHEEVTKALERLAPDVEGKAL